MYLISTSWASTQFQKEKYFQILFCISEVKQQLLKKYHNNNQIHRGTLNKGTKREVFLQTILKSPFPPGSWRLSKTALEVPHSPPQHGCSGNKQAAHPELRLQGAGPFSSEGELCCLLILRLESFCDTCVAAAPAHGRDLACSEHLLSVHFPPTV